jgi:hypothetical protein
VKEPVDLAELARTVARRAERLAILRREDAVAGARVERLERVLDAGRVGAHARLAVSEARLTAHPVPHLRVDELMPGDVYSALIDALPAAAFFDGNLARQELRVPLRLAPTHAVVTWSFFTDVMLDAISGALVKAFEGPLADMARTRFPHLPPIGKWGEITLSQGRLVRRTAGEQPPEPAERSWDLLTGALHLARPGDGDEWGSRIGGADVPFRANRLVVRVAERGGDEYVSIPATAPPGTERYTYEFGIGPTREARRGLKEPRKLSPYTE